MQNDFKMPEFNLSTDQDTKTQTGGASSMNDMQFTDINGDATIENVGTPQPEMQSAEVVGSELPSLEDILRRAIDLGAADAILTAETRPAYKIDGRIHLDEKFEELEQDHIDYILRNVMSQEQVKRLTEDKQIDFSTEMCEQRWRVNIAKQRGTHWATLRMIPTKIHTMKDLQLPGVLADIAERPRGLVLITGPTGSGKSTTLAAMIHHINTTREANIVTIEDPIEFQHNNIRSIVNQREVGTDVLDFKQGLRAVLRQAPDVILVGEMRDLETIEAALTAAETGHLVMGTLHTNSAASTITRIVDVFPPEKQQQVQIQLAGNLLAVMSQTLIKRREGGGRVMAYEIMRNNHGIATLIRENKIQQLSNAMKQGKEEQMVVLNDNLADLVRKKTISLEDALQASDSPDSLKTLLGMNP